MALVGGGGTGNIAGSNPSGIGRGLAYMGKNKYAGWSGPVNATSGTNGTLFDFQSPQNTALETIMSIMIDKTNLGSDEAIGFVIKIDNQVIGQYETERGSTFGFMDIDPVYFFIPGDAQVNIECTTGDAQDIQFTATLICTGVF
jgi:hypothetical protein